MPFGGLSSADIQPRRSHDRVNPVTNAFRRFVLSGHSRNIVCPHAEVRSPMPFGGLSSADGIKRAICLEELGQSPMPFGGLSSADATRPGNFNWSSKVTNAFRRFVLSGLSLRNRLSASASMTFGG